MLDRAAPAGRIVSGTLRFARGGGRTFLQEQRAPYPFHTTRPHYLDVERPDIATLYLQSASGGLYGGDRLHLSLEARPGALAHVTTQAATVVHACDRDGISLRTRIDVADDAVLALTTDPYILFPRSLLSTETRLVLHRRASAIVAEGFAVHDPAGQDAPFRAVGSLFRIEDGDGRLLVEDHGGIAGPAFFGRASPLGRYRAFGSVMILGRPEPGFDPAAVEAALAAVGVLAGATSLPNGAGVAVRLLANDGGALGRGLDAAFAIGFEALIGLAPARRRK